MTDRTGGPSTANYAHRERPESYEEDEELYSDGEDVSPLTARAGGPGHTHGDEEDERLDMQDLILARALRQRAESVEKVATGMLDQPPELPPLHPDDLIDPPTSPQLRPQHVQRQHILPNGAKSPVPTRGAQPRGRSVPGRASSTTGSSPGDPPSGQNCSPLVGGVTGWQDGSGIGSGLARPGPQGTVLRRPSDAQVPSRLDGSPQMCSTKLSELIVRFMRLSALVAMELGREATEERAGIEPLEVLLGVGLGINPAFGRRSRNRGQARENGQGGAAEGSARQRPEEEEEDEEEDEFKQFDPDDLPELEEATRVLFPSLRDPGVANGMHRREGAELEYEIEMVERLQRFYDVPQSTPDVATHMEDLQWQFPAEAVERAAVRFCEAIARWRGKPELETYKKATWIIRNGERRASAGAAMSIDALVHSNPTSPSNSARQPAGPARFAHQAESRTRKPLIEKYFAMPQAVAMQGRKRRRSETDRMQEDGRRMQNPPIFG
ncbi:hypothetical protein IEO21_09315 [Rhodonia placenta]|uniref:Uncharacterized protein n=1 Tax=Rhodonia placenta TaxID=104341 RepID=A0A8H7TYC3_9APHY|nr:hypothetical protein IEO21_09315 [Postia placenta]